MLWRHWVHPRILMTRHGLTHDERPIMKITKITATPVTIDYKEPEVWSQGKRTGITAIVIQIQTDEGIVGIGESVPAPSPQVTMASIDSVAPILVGQDPRQITNRWQDMISKGGFVAYPYTGNAALAGVEIACWDILGKSLGQPVHALLGYAVRDRVPIMGFVQHTTPDKVEADARLMAEQGYTTLYTKVGRGMKEDLEIMEALRRGGGPDVELRCDPNEAWTPGTALRMAHALKHLNIQYIEQPLRMHGISELAELRRRSPIPIAANQASWLNWNVLEVLRLGAADVVMTDPWQAGGIANFWRACAMCETAGIPVVYHSFAPLSIAMRAAMQVLCASPICLYANQTYNHITVDDVVQDPVRITDGHIPVDDRPGIGVELDDNKMSTYHEAYQKKGYLSGYDYTEEVTAGRSFFLPSQ
jgi:L-alanine-DL-glutamate epimerase-like enolase superfamily enzyme